MAKREFRGCICLCGTGTWGNYAPGHDAKHVAKLVRHAICDTTTPWERGQAWQTAIRVLPTDALRHKYRTAMYRSASCHLSSIVDQMVDPRWQQAIHLKALLARDDEFFNRANPFSPLVLATYAAALGWDRHAVNGRRS